MSGSEIGKEGLEDILQFIGEGIIYQEADGRIGYFNRAAERILAIGADEALGLTSTSRDWHLVYEDGSPCPGEDHPSMITLRTGQALSGQVRGIARQGQPTTWISINTRPVTRPGQELPQAVVISFSDISARGRLEESLRLNTEMIRVVFENAAVPMAVTDPRGKWLLTNPAFCQALGYSAEELAGKTSLDVTHPDDIALTREAAQALISGAVPERHLGKRFLAKDGSVRWFDTYLCPLRDEQGKIHALMGVGSDVTERKRAEDELRQSEEKFAKTFQHAPMLMTISSLEDGTLLEANEFFWRVSGFSREEALGRTSVELGWLSPFQRESLKEKLSTQGWVRDEVLTARSKDGRAIHLLINGEIVPLADRRVIVVGAVDITERRLAEDALRRSGETYRTLLAGIPDVVMRFDREGRHLFVSRNVSEVVDLEAEDFIIKTHRELGFAEEQCRMWEDAIGGVFDSGEPWEGEFSFEGKKGLTLCNWRLLPERDARGQVVSVLSLSRDITQHRLAEENYQTLFREMLDGFALHEIILDSAGAPIDYRFLAVNPAFERMTGLTGSDLVGRTVLEVMPGTEAYWIETYGKVALTGEPIFFENYSGETKRHFEVTAFRPAINQFACIFSDVTERKLAAEELRAGEERNRHILQTAMDGFWRLDAHGRLLEVNQAYCRMSGYSQEELLGMGISDLEAVESPNHIAVPVRTLMKKGEDRFETKHRRKDGSLFDVELSVQNMDDDGGGEMVCFLRDITDRLRTERELRASEERFRQLYENAPIAYQSLDPDGLIRDVNQVWLDILGHGREEVLGRWFGSFLLPDFVPHFEANFPCFKDAGNIQGVEFQMRRKDGSPLLVSFNGVISHDNDGKMIRTHCVFHDITENRRLEAQLRQAQKMEALGTLSGGIAHDFNNILGAVLGFAEIAHEDAIQGRVDPADLEQIVASAQRAKELVKQILTFSRKNEPALRPMSLNQACKRAQDILRRTLPKMIAVECDLAQDLPPVQADPTQVEQVLLNLSSNAADAMAEGGRLSLSTGAFRVDEEFRRLHPEAPLGDYVLLAVSDTGFGMDPETREHIFEPFFTTKGVGRGTGLGLSTVYGIVKSHGGYIYCHSQPGQGTTFRLYWPVLAAEATSIQPTEATAQDEAALVGVETILVADDEENLRNIAARTLRTMGYEVMAASSGEEALRLYFDRPAPPDLVLMDLGMPGMGGHRALREILARHPQAKVIIASGYAAHNQVRVSLEAGAAGYVAKPFHRLDLLGAVRRALDAGKA